MSIDDIKPALQPLHPDKPEPPIVAGDVWQKIATGKTSVNAPTCRIFRYVPEKRLVLVFRSGVLYCHSERVFRRDWRPC